MDRSPLLPFRHQSVLTRLPEVSPKKFIRNTLHHLPSKSVKQYQSSTPDPSLTIKMMKMCDRPINPQSTVNSLNDASDYANDTLNHLIQNNAVTFIAPNDFINQIHKESLSCSPTLKRELRPNTRMTSKKTMENASRKSFYEMIQLDLQKDNSGPYANTVKKIADRKIEITGFQVPKIMTKKHKNGSEEEMKKTESVGKTFQLSKEIGFRRSPKPVVVPNRKNKYFKPLKHGLEAGTLYFHYNNF
jgi:hypothetical protein